jgi:hypothetical protein
VDNWVNDIAKDMLDVPHLQITLTIDDLLRPFFYADRSLLKLLLQVAAQAVREVIDGIYPGLLTILSSCSALLALPSWPNTPSVRKRARIGRAQCSCHGF